MINKEWQLAKKKVDPDYEGSLFEKLGFDPVLCPVCSAHLRDGVCLNLCHLSPVFQDNAEITHEGSDLLDMYKRPVE